MTKKGVWDLQEVRDEYLEANWTYSSSGGPYSLYGIGGNPHGSLGVNDIISRSSPIQIPGTPWSKPETPYRTSFAFLN